MIIVGVDRFEKTCAFYVSICRTKSHCCVFHRLRGQLETASGSAPFRPSSASSDIEPFVVIR